MNFIDAAITLLREHGRPMHVEELCREAVDRGLLARPGKTPLRSMKARLTTEAKKPDGGGVIRVEPDVWFLRELELPTEEEPEVAEEEAALQAPVAEAPEAVEEAALQPPVAEEPEADEEAAPSEAPAATSELDLQVDGDEAVPEPAAMSPEERDFAELYGDELGSTTPVADLTEYRDEHTQDEDRLLLPEIVAEKGRGRGRVAGRKGRRGAREERPRRERARAADKRPADAEAREGAAADRVEVSQAEAPVLTEELSTEGAGALRLRPGSPLSDAAYETLAEVKNGQPMQVKQLAQMMRKRRRLEGDPLEMWPLIKVALLTDEQQHRARGLRPRVVHRGRDLFGAAGGAVRAELARAERALERAHLDMLAATHAALADQLSQLDLPALERLVQLYLEREGWGSVRWIKRSGRSGYALVEPADIPGPVLVGVRAGDVPVDRRGVGELRAGLDAKDLPRGLLIAPQELAEEARVELDRGGRPVTTLVGARMVRAMASSGIGVLSTSVPVQYLDVELFDAIAEG
jgi:hypothetical protein